MEINYSSLIGQGKNFKFIPLIKFTVGPRSSRRLLENGLLSVSPGLAVTLS